MVDFYCFSVSASNTLSFLRKQSYVQAQSVIHLCRRPVAVPTMILRPGLTIRQPTPELSHREKAGGKPTPMSTHTQARSDWLAPTVSQDGIHEGHRLEGEMSHQHSPLLSPWQWATATGASSPLSSTSLGDRPQLSSGT